ncbi:MAG: hypothetical protein J7501_04000, partial [Bdellovibrio sp.]|nr:hypothetical protein [Bdellovibrio sp.]
MTVVEILVVLGIVGVVALGNAVFIANFNKELKETENVSQEQSELAILNVSAVNILKKSAASFNKLNLADDSNRNFFDYYPDVPFSTLQEVASGFEKRSFTIKAGQTNRYFYLIQSEEADYDSLVYDPMYAYSQASPAPNKFVSGTVEYRGLNSIAKLTGIGGAPNAGTMTKVFQKRWENGKMFLLSCPTYLRPVIGGNINVLQPPRFASFLGKVAGVDLIPVNTSETRVPYFNVNPTTLTTYTSVDRYLRQLPTVGGAAPFVKVEPVKLVRFQLRTAKTPGLADLYWQELVNGEYVDKAQLIANVKSVSFTRKAITLPLISMEVEQ